MKQQQHTEFLAHRYVFSEEEVLGEVAPEGLEAAGLLAHVCCDVLLVALLRLRRASAAAFRCRLARPSPRVVIRLRSVR